MIRGAWRLEHRQEDSSTQEYRALAHLAKVPVQPEVLVLEGLAKVFQITMAQDAVAGSGLYQLSARRAFPMLGGISGCPFWEFSGWFSVRDYKAAGNLYVLNCRFWKPYSYLLASDWSLSMIFVLYCHVGAWRLGCELVPHCPEGNSSYQHNAGKLHWHALKGTS